MKFPKKVKTQMEIKNIQWPENCGQKIVQQLKCKKYGLLFLRRGGNNNDKRTTLFIK